MSAIFAVLGFGTARGDTPTDAITDDAVDAAIRQAVNWIKSHRNDEANWEPKHLSKEQHDFAGDSALALLALLYAGEDPRSEWMDKAIDWVTDQKLVGTYAYGVRAHMLALVPGMSSRLQSDVQWLLAAPATKVDPGAYGYQAADKDGVLLHWDNSATQFGLLGLWMAAEAGAEVPNEFWETQGRHWLKNQKSDGGWAYVQNRNSSGSMTAAGVASLFVVLDQRYADRPKDAAALENALQAGLDWLAREYRVDTNPKCQEGNRWLFYYLYSVERAGRASGYRAFGDKDWFPDGAGYLLDTQQEDGRWLATHGDMSDLRNTAFGLMFLCHGRAPLLFNKLEFGTDWNRRSRDVAGLARYSSRVLERLLNWQIVRLDADLDALLEAPVLYMSGESKREFTDVEVQKLLEYTQRGGLLFAVGGKESTAFSDSIDSFARRAFPDYPIRPVGRNHPLLNGEVSFAFESPPLLLEVHNGVRPLLLLSTQDLTPSWARGVARPATEKDLQLGLNVYLYATDKSTIRSRLDSAAIPLRDRKPDRTLRLARIKHSGRWDIEPYGWTRLRRYLQNEAGVQLLIASGVPLDSPELSEFRVAHIGGLGKFELTEDEQKGLRKFLNDGGTLIADAIGGSAEFTASLEQYLAQATQEEARPVPATSPLFTADAFPGAVDLTGTQFRRSVRGMSGRGTPVLRAFSTKRRMMAIYSPLDITTSLLGTPVYGLQGYSGDTALKLVRNLLLYAELSTADKARVHRADKE